MICSFTQTTRQASKPFFVNNNNARFLFDSCVYITDSSVLAKVLLPATKYYLYIHSIDQFSIIPLVFNATYCKFELRCYRSTKCPLQIPHSRQSFVYVDAMYISMARFWPKFRLHFPFMSTDNRRVFS